MEVGKMNKVWARLPEYMQVWLASLGVITADEPTEFGGPFGAFKETKLRKMEKLPTNSERIRFIQRQVSEMDAEKDHDRMQQRQRVVKFLCQEIDERHSMELDEEQKNRIQKAEDDAVKKYLDLSAMRS
jgi:hypothetical protein